MRETVSVLRAYQLFRQLGSRHLVVTDIANRVVGLLSRLDFEHDVLHGLVHAHVHAHGEDQAHASARKEQQNVAAAAVQVAEVSIA